MESQAIEIYALEASLAMMQQVLNDVLDLESELEPSWPLSLGLKTVCTAPAGMDAGKFEHSPRPFPLHRAIRAMLGNVLVATKAKGLELDIELDAAIDQLATGVNENEDGLWVVGNEIRLRQILTNLASNAVSDLCPYLAMVDIVGHN